MEKVLNFTTHKEWTLHVASFENYTRGCGSWEKATFLEKKSPKEFRQIVLDLENRNRSGNFASIHRNIIYYYWVTESEVMIDDRSKFGHKNQSSRKEISTTIPKTYVRGEILTVAEASKKIKTLGELPENERALLIEFLYDSPIDIDDNPTDKELNTKIIKIKGEYKRETFFEFLDTFCEISIFDEKELVPIKEN